VTVVEDEITRSLSNHGVDSFSWDDTWDKLDIDSLELVNVAMDVEDALKILIDVRKLDTVPTPRHLVKLVEEELYGGP
jgi:hypothetical protein